MATANVKSPGRLVLNVFGIRSCNESMRAISRELPYSRFRGEKRGRETPYGVRLVSCLWWKAFKKEHEYQRNPHSAPPSMPQEESSPARKSGQDDLQPIKQP
jgi:hypothetical protein